MRFQEIRFRFSSRLAFVFEIKTSRSTSSLLIYGLSGCARYFTSVDNVYRALAVNQAICRKRKDWTCLVLATWQLSPCTRPTSWNVLLKRVAFCHERAAFRSERNRAMTMICSRLRGPIKISNKGGTVIYVIASDVNVRRGISIDF